MEPSFDLPTDLIGYWWFEHDSEDSPGLLIVDDLSRAIQFHTTQRRLKKNEIMRLWYSVENANTLRFRLRPDAEGWTRTVQRGEMGFSISADQKTFPLTPAILSDLPEWIEEDYRMAMALMDEKDSQ